jgi:ribonuclease HII
VAAASIIAKVTRDRIMHRYEALYPSFSFATHKGYPTARHLQELREYGPCDIHRRSFKPVAELVNQYALF